MHGAFGVAVVELDAVRGGAAEEGGVDQVGAPRTPGHRDLARRTCRREHRLSLGCDRAACARDHHADGVEQVPARVMAGVLGQRCVAQRADEFDDRVGRARGGMARVKGLGVRHRKISGGEFDRTLAKKCRVSPLDDIPNICHIVLVLLTEGVVMRRLDGGAGCGARGKGS